MRVLSRRAICPKAVASGYSYGAGFIVLTEPCPSLLPPSAPCGRPPPLRRRRWALARRLLGCDPGAFTSVVLSGSVARCPPVEAERAATWGRRPLLDGVGEVCKGRRDRALGLSRFDPTPARPVTSPYQQQQRHAATASSATEDSSRRPRRALPPAGDRCGGAQG